MRALFILCILLTACERIPLTEQQQAATIIADRAAALSQKADSGTPTPELCSRAKTQFAATRQHVLNTWNDETGIHEQVYSDTQLSVALRRLASLVVQCIGSQPSTPDDKELLINAETIMMVTTYNWRTP